MNTQDNFINAVKEVKDYMYDRCNYLTDEQKVLIEGELTMFLTKSFIKKAEATCKGESIRVRSNKPVSICKLRVDLNNGDISEDEFIKALKERRDRFESNAV